MVHVNKDHDGDIWINSHTGEIFVTPTEARQLIADIMAALDEPMKPSDVILNLLPDTTTQAYQEFADQPEISVGFKSVPAGTAPQGFSAWYEHYKFAVKNGYVR